MNMQTGFMPKPKKPGRPPQAKPAIHKTIGVHVRSEKDLVYLYARAEAEYRSASQVMYLMLKREREAAEAAQGKN